MIYRISTLFFCLLLSITQVNAQKCECVSFPVKPTRCIVECLKTATPEQLEKSLKLPRPLAQNIPAARARGVIKSVEDFKKYLPREQYEQLVFSVNNSITDNGDGLHNNATGNGNTFNTTIIYGYDANHNAVQVSPGTTLNLSTENQVSGQFRTIKNNIEFIDANSRPARYSGEVVNDLPDGKGTASGSFIHIDGQTIHYRYTGEWQNGKQEGKGTLQLLGSWTLKDCTFVNNFATGKCRVEIPNVTIYEGMVNFGIFNGQGTATMILDSDIMNCPQCRKYVGEWQWGVKSGLGKCFDKSGTLIYEGKFANDAPIERYPNRNR